MRFVLSFVCVLTACSKPNPEACCATDEQCAALGAGELRPCDIGQACSSDFTCVAAECTTSADCTSPDAPVCSLGLCVSSCRVDEDCADVAGRPMCASDGVCVGCETADQCPLDAAICDADTRECRGCEKDAECGSGVCLAADGICADESEVVFATPSGGTDAGECTKTQPCATLDFALAKVTTMRKVLRLEGGGTFNLASVFDIDRSVYIAGGDTTIAIDRAGPAVRTTGNVHNIVLDKVNVAASSGDAIEITSTNSIRAFNAELGRVNVNGGAYSATGSRMVGGVNCTSGTVSVETSTFANAHLAGSNCTIVVDRTLFDR